jgi:hypothetical protein
MYKSDNPDTKSGIINTDLFFPLSQFGSENFVSSTEGSFWQKA